ncbi:MAG: putative 4-hydroxybenzoate polyprenyltransferase [Bacteroidales bacterium]|jgi:4-hydroxybenzoate polyprenyltransferase|nr:putative 4-hydroxybenzoate polyprenyltransferase [Bacteroidales bacterium]
MTELLGQVKKYLSLVKFSHTIFAMPFALTGFALAAVQPDYGFSLRLLVLVVLCMVFARNAAMSFNRLADRHFDALNPRTRNREIPAGIINPKAATAFVIINAVLFVAAAGFINRLTLWLSPVALLIILGYSLTKRFTSLCHFILGLGLSLAPTGAYIAVTGKFDLLPVIYSLIVITWVSGFDIIYALQDDVFDRENRLFSIPSALGRKRALAVSNSIHFLTFVLVVAAGVAGNGGILFWAGATLFTIFLIMQHRLVRHDDLSRVTIAFATVNGIASVLFALFVILDLVLRNR